MARFARIGARSGNASTRCDHKAVLGNYASACASQRISASDEKQDCTALGEFASKWATFAELVEASDHLEKCVLPPRPGVS
jgi:hypothetical protein